MSTTGSLLPLLLVGAAFVAAQGCEETPANCGSDSDCEGADCGPGSMPFCDLTTTSCSCTPFSGSGGAGGTGGTGGRETASGTPRVGVDLGDATTRSSLKLIGTDGSLSDIGDALFPGSSAEDEPKTRQLAYDWAGQTLYAVNVGLDQNHQLFSIDVCTGQASKVGDLRRPDDMPFVNLEGLAIDGDGQIYVSGSLDDQIYSKTLLRVLISDGEITTEVVGDFGQTREGVERGLDVGDADRMFFVDDQLYITDTFVEEGDIFRTYVYEVDVANVGNPNPQVPLFDSAFELSSIAWDNVSATESVSWESTPDMAAAEGWYVIDLETAPSTRRIEGLANFDGPFAFVDRDCPTP